MALKDLLVHVDHTPSALMRLRMAADLGRRHGSRLTALYVREVDARQLHAQSTAEFGLVCGSDIHRDERRTAQAHEATVQRLTQELDAIRGESGLEVELRIVEGAAATVVPQYARFADLCILSQDVRSNAGAGGYTFSEAVLFGTGRPVLFVPAHGAFTTLGHHLLVAWNSSRSSARALNDSLCLIERAERTTVLAVNPAEYIERYQALAPEQIVAHLRRHGSPVEGRWRENVQRGAIAEVIQAEAHAVGADLIVAGAFGHPKLWEKLMGGVTCGLLDGMTLPVLMSH